MIISHAKGILNHIVKTKCLSPIGCSQTCVTVRKGSYPCPISGITLQRHCMTQIFFLVMPEIDFFSNTSQDRRFISITKARVSGSSFGPQSEPVWTSNDYIKSLGHSVIHRFLKIIERLLSFEYQTSWFTRKAQPSFAISVNHFHSICKFHSWLCYFSAFICLSKLPNMYFKNASRHPVVSQVGTRIS